MAEAPAGAARKQRETVAVGSSGNPRGSAKALSYCQPQRGGGVKVLLLSHKKVTKRLWPAASYGKIGIVGYRLFAGKGRVIL